MLLLLEALYREKFQIFLDAGGIDVDFLRYLDGMPTLNTRGVKLEITALSEFYRRPVEIYAGQTISTMVTSDSVDYDSNRPPIRITICIIVFQKMTRNRLSLATLLGCLKILLCFSML